MSKKIIVTGATGQDGSYMIEYLLKNTENTIIAGIRRTSQAILSNLKDVIDNPRLKLVTLDLCDGHSIDNLIREEKPDYFINLGGYTFVADSWINPAIYLQVNAESLIHILEAVRKYVPHCRIYSAGSSEQFGDVKYSPQDENHPMSPRSLYGVSKCAASHICKVYRETYNLYVVHGVLFNHEGERRQNYFITRKITQNVARIKHNIDNKNWNFQPLFVGDIFSERDWSHSEDFVDGIWRMLNQEKYRKTHKLLGGSHESLWMKIPNKNWLKEYILSSGEKHTVKEFIELSFGIAGISGEWFNSTGDLEDYEYLLCNADGSPTKEKICLVKIDKQFLRPCEVKLLLGNSSLVRKELKWEPKVSFSQLVKRMVINDIKNCESHLG